METQTGQRYRYGKAGAVIHIRETADGRFRRVVSFHRVDDSQRRSCFVNDDGVEGYNNAGHYEFDALGDLLVLIRDIREQLYCREMPGRCTNFGRSGTCDAPATHFDRELIQWGCDDHRDVGYEAIPRRMCLVPLDSDLADSAA